MNPLHLGCKASQLYQVSTLRNVSGHCTLILINSKTLSIHSSEFYPYLLSFSEIKLIIKCS